jgi:hypothetical protein
MDTSILSQRAAVAPEIQCASTTASNLYPFTPAEALEWGMGLIPLNNDKRPASHLLPKDSLGKPTWKPFQERWATPDEVAAWVSRTPAGFAAVTGAISSRISVDFDGEAGIETARKLGITEDGPIVPHRRTPSGGLHCDFVHPGWHVKTQNHVSNKMLGARWPGLDCKGDGGYVGVSGRMAHGEYTWLRDPEPYSLDLLSDELRADLGILRPPDAEAPLLAAAAPGETKVSARPRIVTAAASSAVPIPQSEHPRVDPYVLIGMAFEKIAEGTGRNDAGFWLACQLRDHGFTESETLTFGPHFVAHVPATNTKGQVEAYTVRDFVSSTRQAYSRPARDSWATPTAEPEDADADAEMESSNDPTDIDNGDSAEKATESNATQAGTEPGTEPLIAAAQLDDGQGTDAVAQDELIPTVLGGADSRDPEEVVEPQVQPHGRPEDPKSRKARKVLQDILGLDVDQLIKHGSGGGIYVMYLDKGRTVDIGNAGKMISERAFRVSVLDSLNQTLPRFKPGGWKKCLDAMLELVEVRTTLGPDAMVHGWVESLIENFAPCVPSLSEPTEDVAEIFAGWVGHRFHRSYPAVFETGVSGRVVVKLRDLHAYVTRRFGARLSESDLSSSLSKIGFFSLSTLNGPMWEGHRLRVNRVWVAPASLFPDMKLRLEQNDHRIVRVSDAEWGAEERVGRIAGLIDESRMGT